MAEFNDRNALAAISSRAAQDQDFRQRLIRDPHAAIKEATGTTVPPTLRIKFIEKDPDIDVLIVLPDLIREVGELSEEDVSIVTGGTNWGCEGGTSL
jgi:hypothetical protein